MGFRSVAGTVDHVANCRIDNAIPDSSNRKDDANHTDGDGTTLGNERRQKNAEWQT
jgi:hypothetical protein